MVAVLAYFDLTNTRPFPKDSPLYAPQFMHSVPQPPISGKPDKNLEQVAVELDRTSPFLTTAEWSVYSVSQADAHLPLYRPLTQRKDR